MAKKCKGHCGTGKANAFERRAIADWKRKSAKASSSTRSLLDDPGFTFVGLLPAPPTPGTPQFMACMPPWMGAYMIAAQQDGHLSQIYSLQPTKDGYLESYANCMAGFTT